MTNNIIKRIDRRKKPIDMVITTVYDLNSEKDKKAIQDEIKELADWYYDLYMNNVISALEYEDDLYEIGYYDSDIWG